MPKKPEWNEISCPRCREPMAISASKCPHCHTEFSATEVNRRKSAHRASIFIVIGLVVLAGFVLWLADYRLSRSQGETSEALASSPAPSTKSFTQVIAEIAACDKSTAAFADAVKADIGSKADVAARFVIAACHQVSTDYDAAAPQTSTLSQAQKDDRCNDAYFGPESLANSWLSRKGVNAEELAQDQRDRAECMRWVRHQLAKE